MMKFAALAISLFLVSNPSLAKRTPVQLALDGQRLTTQKTQIATKSVLAHVASRTQRRLLVINEIIDDNDDELIKSLADHALQEERFIWDNL